MSTSSARAWFLLTSKPHKDELAHAQLLNQGYEVYRPLAKRLKKRNGKMITTVESLFPRYLFIHLDNGITDNWSSVRYTYGISDFVRFGKQSLPKPVPNHIIANLQDQEETLGERLIDLERFHKGDQVLIKDGPYKNLLAIFQQYEGEQRVMLLLNLLHTETRLTTDSINIERY